MRFLRRFQCRVITPVSAMGLTKYDGLPAAEAARLAWTRPGIKPDHHARAVAQVRDAMPVLARALDRLEEEPTNE